MQTVLASLIPQVARVWVNDVMLFAPTASDFVVVLPEFFQLVREANLKLNMAKRSLFELEVLWRGRLISSKGVRQDPNGVDVLRRLPVPEPMADLQRFLIANNWLHESLPDYAHVVAPLLAQLEAEKKRIGKRSEHALMVATHCDPTDSVTEHAAYAAVISLTKDSAMMVHPDPDAELCAFTDDSLSRYVIVVTQVKHWHPGVSVDKQNHKLIIYKGGEFKDLQLNWTVVEREAFPITKACTDLAFIFLQPRGFRLLCDHANLVYIFAPPTELKKHVCGRLQSWPMLLCGLPYHIKHVSGEVHLWADIISRWHTQDKEVLSMAAVQTRRHFFAPVGSLSRLRPFADENFVAPTLEHVRAAQDLARRERSNLRVDFAEDGGVVMDTGRPWFLNAAKDLLAKIFVVAHCGSQGHRGQEPMIATIKQLFYIPQSSENILYFG